MLPINLQAILLIYYNLELKQIEIPQPAIVSILILAAPDAVYSVRMTRQGQK